MLSPSQCLVELPLVVGLALQGQVAEALGWLVQDGEALEVVAQVAGQRVGQEAGQKADQRASSLELRRTPPLLGKGLEVGQDPAGLLECWSPQRPWTSMLEPRTSLCLAHRRRSHPQLRFYLR